MNMRWSPDSNARVVVLLDNTSPELWVVGYINVAMVGEEAILETPLIGMH